jgi:polysaccharide export outer membrane protein
MPAPATKADAEHPAETMAAGEAPAKVETPANQPSPTDGKPAQNGTAGSLASVSAPPPAALTIREGDTLKISFPGAPNLDVTQQVRRDGRITLSLVGEVIASGLTPVALESELLQRYSSQLVSKEVMVTVLSSTFTIYVSGAVLRPGKLSADRPLTALDAIMEAGGFDMGKANTKAVLVIREENGILNNYKLNLKGVLEGKQGESFYLRPYDKVFVPEKVSWF